MAEEDDPSGPDQSGDDQEGVASSDEAQIFDDLTVLSNDTGDDGLDEVEEFGAAPEAADDGGLENVQPSGNVIGGAAAPEDETGALIAEAPDIPTSPPGGVPGLPDIPEGTEG